jgi:uncharacterized Zn finger protein (UPF0148 family)
MSRESNSLAQRRVPDLCQGSYVRPREVTERGESNQPTRGVCPICGKELSVNRATSGLRAHRAGESQPQRDARRQAAEVSTRSRRQEEIRKHARLRHVAREVDEAWDAWMNNDQDEGQDRVERAIGRLRAALREWE